MGCNQACPYNTLRGCIAIEVGARCPPSNSAKAETKPPALDEDFETILICAERYACGRRTYMPSLVVGYITPLLPKLTDNALRVLYLDIAGASDFGDESIDKPCWMKLLADVRAEIERRKQ